MFPLPDLYDWLVWVVCFCILVIRQVLFFKTQILLYQKTEIYVTWKLQNSGERNSRVICTLGENIPHHGRINIVKIPILPIMIYRINTYYCSFFLIVYLKITLNFTPLYFTIIGVTGTCVPSSVFVCLTWPAKTIWRKQHRKHHIAWCQIVCQTTVITAAHTT